MSRQQVAIKNSAMGLISQIVTLIFQFWTRSIFVKYLGVELLGISSTFSSILNTLSLAELGFQSAVVYSLYKPLANDNKEKVNEIVNVLKVIYRSIGIFFIVVGIICCPFLKFVLSGVEISITIYLIFIIHVLNSSCSYFLAYKRALFHADRKGYITKAIDTVMTIIFSLIKVIAVIKTSDYIIYISLTTLQTIVSNTFVNVVSRKRYPYLRRTKFNVSIFRDIWDNVRSLFVGKIASYVYFSTDNLVISAVVGTVSVGYLVNYTTIISSMKTLTDSILSPIAPIIGNMIAEGDDPVKHEKVFRTYSYIRYVIACIAVIPIIVLLQGFISVWIGEEYLLSDIIVWLCCFDLYIHLVHSSLCDFIYGNGLFKADRNIEIAGAVSNLTISIILVYKIGMKGALIGTIISQSIFWIGRSNLVYKKCFAEVKKGLARYWLRNVVYLGLFFTVSYLMTIVYKHIQVETFVIKFIIGGICSEVIIVITQVIVFGRTNEFKQLESMVLNIIRSRIRSVIGNRK